MVNGDNHACELIISRVIVHDFDFKIDN